MAVYLCHEFPDLFEHDAAVVDAAPGRVLLDRSALHPGGGGQVSDTGWIEYGDGVVPIVGVETVTTDGGEEQRWHLLGGDSVELSGTVQVRVDAERRARVASLHTDSHILNALVFERFPGTLVTGAQINADGTGRMDFDLSQVDNDVLRGLDAGINAVIASGVDVRSVYVDAAEAERTPGLVRSLSVAPPPTPDGTLRLIEIDGVDRQACGGTHLSNTAQSAPVRITKVENKGKRNRRIRFELLV
jgi:misacylated tRNA(Ala) deacylase